MEQKKLKEHLDNARKDDNEATTYIESIDAEVDAGLAELIRIINEETPLETTGSCSGLIEDYFDLEYLRKHNATPENTDNPMYTNTLTNQFYIKIKSPYHETDEDGNLHIDHEFFPVRDALNNLRVNADIKVWAGLEVEINYRSYHLHKSNETRSTITLEPETLRFLEEIYPQKHYNPDTKDEYEAHDQYIKQTIDTLITVFKNYDALTDFPDHNTILRRNIEKDKWGTKSFYSSTDYQFPPRE